MTPAINPVCAGCNQPRALGPQPCNPIYCLQVTAHEIDQMVQAMDRAGTGKIHYQDYLSMASASVEDQRRHFASDTVIFREGDTSDFFYLITAGKVRMLLTTHCPLPTLYYPPLTTDSWVRCARYLLPTTHHPPPTTHDPPPTTHYPLPRCAS